MIIKEYCHGNGRTNYYEFVTVKDLAHWAGGMIFNNDGIDLEEYQAVPWADLSDPEEICEVLNGFLEETYEPVVDAEEAEGYATLILP